MIPATVQLEQLTRDGFVIIPDLISDATVNNLTAIMESTDATYGRRNLLANFEGIRSVVRSDAVCSLVHSVLGSNAFAVRGLFFDKTPAANWMVGWHQDRTIAVQARREAPGFTLWTMKADVNHVQPPASVMEQMLAVRLHLDDTDETNGGLRIIPGSHRAGFISEDAVGDWVRRHEPITCLVPRSGALVMRPLLLHASSKATHPAHRRVLHLEFASQSLPSGLEWAIRV